MFLTLNQVQWITKQSSLHFSNCKNAGVLIDIQILTSLCRIVLGSWSLIEDHTTWPTWLPWIEIQDVVNPLSPDPAWALLMMPKADLARNYPILMGTLWCWGLARSSPKPNAWGLRPLYFWKSNMDLFPILALLARAFLSVPSPQCFKQAQGFWPISRHPWSLILWEF